jgi:CelD/BcsL family acetyltransferase involved in cellulose biosynthesis
MSLAPYRTLVFRSAAELCSWAPAWDDLWRRSEVATPRARAPIVAEWLDKFAGRRRIRILAVELNGRLVAALPLVSKRIAGVVQVLTLPVNDWAMCGELLLDQDADPASVLAPLVSWLTQPGTPILWLDYLPLQTQRWQAFLAASQRAGLCQAMRQQFDVGVVDIERTWSAYAAEYPKRGRRNRQRQAKALEQAGGAELHLLNAIAPGDAPALVRRGFEVERRSWKGSEQSSVLQHPAALSYYSAEARQLAEWGLLELSFLEHQDRPIAFQYGFQAKGTYFIPKVGYDQEFAKFAPGVQLMQQILRRQHEETSCHRVDFNGPLSDWTRDFATETYPLSRFVGARNCLSHHLVMQAYDRLLPKFRRALSSRNTAASPPSAEGSIEVSPPRGNA